MTIGLRTAESTVTVTAVSAIFLAANPNRVAVTISSPAAARVSISSQTPAVAGSGMTLMPLTKPIMFTSDVPGNWIQGNLYAITSAGTETLGVLESLRV
jgi:hypothetical protein